MLNDIVLIQKKNARKKDNLEKKIKPRKEEGMYKGIPIGDEELGEDNVEITLLSYGV